MPHHIKICQKPNISIDKTEMTKWMRLDNIRFDIFNLLVLRLEYKRQVAYDEQERDRMKRFW